MAARATDHGGILASDADREQVIDALKSAFVQGLLTRDELGLRAGQALASRTYTQLSAITADIDVRLARVQPRPGPAQGQGAVPKRVNKKAVAWAAGLVFVPPALGAAFLTFYGGFLVLLVLAFAGAVVTAPAHRGGAAKGFSDARFRPGP
jgi:hypothetical protein